MFEWLKQLFAPPVPPSPTQMVPYLLGQVGGMTDSADCFSGCPLESTYYRGGEGLVNILLKLNEYYGLNTAEQFLIFVQNQDLTPSRFIVSFNRFARRDFVYDPSVLTNTGYDPISWFGSGENSEEIQTMFRQKVQEAYYSLLPNQ